MIRLLRFSTLRSSRLQVLRARCQSTTSNSTSAERLQSRTDRIVARLPRSLRPYAASLRTAPLTHLLSFLVLHEITAVVPLLSIFAVLHYTNWLPSWFSNGVWVQQGTEKFGRYLRRKGWFVDDTTGSSHADRVNPEAREERGMTGEKNWGLSDQGTRILIEIATAWAVTKALLPVRLLLSVWATPWFASVFLVPGTRYFERTLGRAKTFSTKQPLRTGPEAGPRPVGGEKGGVRNDKALKD